MDGEDGHLLREVDKPNVEQKFSVNGDDGGQPEDHRIAAVVAALCFFPTGLASLYHSSKVCQLYRRGDVQGSQWASHRTSHLVLLTYRLSVFVWLALFLLVSASLVLGLCFAIDSNKH